jgi:hypothetical protein
MGTKKIALRLLVGVLLLAALPAQAAFSQADADVAARSLGFINGLGGTLNVQVIYDPENTASYADAQAAMAALSATKGGKVRFLPALTPVSSIGRGKVAYVSMGIGSHHNAVRTAAAANNMLTITHDQNCVLARACAMYISADPSVTIIVSQSALASTSYQPAAALKMMIKEMP